MWLLLPLHGCIDVAEDASLLRASTAAGVGLLGSASLSLEGGVTLPFVTAFVTDPGLTLVTPNFGQPGEAGSAPTQRLDFRADAPGTYGFAAHLDGDPAGRPTLTGSIGFVSIADLALDTSRWARERSLLVLDEVHLETGAQVGGLVFVDDAGRRVEGHADLWVEEDDAGVLGDLAEVVDGVMAIDTTQARVGGTTVALLSGASLELPTFVPHALPEGIDAAWTLDVAASEADEPVLEVWLTAPDGGPLVTDREFGACAGSDDPVLTLAALDGLATADAGCVVRACLDPLAAEHELGLCVGDACTTLRAAARLEIDDDPGGPTCPWT